MSPISVIPPLRVTFIKQYTNYTGRVLRRYQSSRGKVLDIMVRPGRREFFTMTNMEAKAEAMKRFQAGEGI